MTATQAQAAAGTTNAAGATPADQKPDTIDAPTLQINSIEDFLSAVNVAVAAEGLEKQIKNYNRDGFKGVDGLASVRNNAHLAVMAGCILRQIARNGGDAPTFLGTEKKSGLIAQFGARAAGEAHQETRIAAYVVIAEDLGIKRNKGESATDFIARIHAGVAAKAAKA